jgi:hypothetical protein
MFKEGELCDLNLNYLADKAYQTNEFPNILTPKKRKSELSTEETIVNSLIEKKRVKVENVIGRIKLFNCLNHKWRHERNLHPIIFTTIAQIVNIDMEFHPIRRDNS